MGKERFGYDASGNMLFNREYDLTYGTGNRLLSYACDNVRFTYDDDGNIVTKITPEGTTQYQWDSENRIIGITKPDGTVIAYQYDELGRRVQKTVTGQTSGGSWYWSYLSGDVYRETSPLGRSTYIHGPGVDEHLSVSSQIGYGQTTSAYYMADGLGSIARIVDGSGSVLNQYRYGAFGKMKQVQESFANSYAYTGREWDPDAGLYYYRARWYDPAVGRFPSEDPIGFAGGEANVYRYVGNNPINSTDPLGEGVYSCTRPLKPPVPSFVWQYLHRGHQFLWVESMNPQGWGLAPQGGYEKLSGPGISVPGWIEPELTRDRGPGEVITDDPCWEARIKKRIESERDRPQMYNLSAHNCYSWAREDVLRKSLQWGAR